MVGDVVTSVTINSIKSHLPHWHGQKPAIDGMYYESVAEERVNGIIHSDRVITRL